LARERVTGSPTTRRYVDQRQPHPAPGQLPRELGADAGRSAGGQRDALQLIGTGR
jgi:hypothetical protein